MKILFKTESCCQLSSANLVPILLIRLNICRKTAKVSSTLATLTRLKHTHALCLLIKSISVCLCPKKSCWSIRKSTCDPFRPITTKKLLHLGAKLYRWRKMCVVKYWVFFGRCKDFIGNSSASSDLRGGKGAWSALWELSKPVSRN